MKTKILMPDISKMFRKMTFDLVLHSDCLDIDGNASKPHISIFDEIEIFAEISF